MADFAPHDLTSNTSHSPYVVSASSFFSGTGSDPFHAFDGVIGALSGCWLGTGGGVDWLQIDLGSGNAKVLSNYAIATNTSSDVTVEATRAPNTWTMRGSNDGTTWTTVDTQTGVTGWGSGTTTLFTIASPGVTAYRYFQLNITANNGDATYTQVAELYLYELVPIVSGELGPHDLVGDSSHPPFVVSASTAFGLAGYSEFNAFDGTVTGTAGWTGTNFAGSSGRVDWLEIDLGSAHILGSYAIAVNDITRFPAAWLMEGSNDNSTWTTVDTQTAQTTWTSGVAVTYTCATATTAYRYFRLYITNNASGGSAAYTNVGELTLYGAASLTAQTITFPSISNHVNGDPPFALGATASSGLTVSYSVTSGPATISGSTVTITGPGAVTIEADQAGNGTYAAATPVSQSFNVSHAQRGNIAYDQIKASDRTGNGNQLLTWSTTVPATAGAAGNAGQIAYDGTYLYLCVSSDVWLRAAISTW